MERGTREEVFSQQLKRLAAVDRFLRGSPIDSQFGLLELEKIKGDVERLKSIIQQADTTQRQVIESFESVARDVDDLLHIVRRLQHVPTSTEIVEEEFAGLKGVIKSKLEDIGRTITEIKEGEDVGRFLLPHANQQPPQPSPSADAPSTSSGVPQSNINEKTEWERKSTSIHLSYYRSRIEDLDGQLKCCLLFITLFPENKFIRKTQLIHWWIGEGLVKASGGKTSTENGEMRIRELVCKGLLEPNYSKWSLGLVGCRMYPWVYRLLISDPLRERERFLSWSGRKLLVHSAKEHKSSDPNEENLTTLYNISNQYLRFDQDWFLRKKSLAVVQLGCWHGIGKHHIEPESVEFLQGLGSCTNLKYLSLRGISRIEVLPDSIEKLTGLLVLDLRACHNLEKLPAAIALLKRLRYLDVSECYLLEHMPKGLGSLTDLQVLKGFVVGNSRSKNPCRFGELAKLTKLRKLGINIGRDSVISEDEFHTMKHFKALRSLTVRWGVIAKVVSKRAETLMKIFLSPPPNLEKLDLRCFPRETFLDWASPTELENLKKLYIRGGILVSIGNKTGWKVEVLRLKFLDKLVLERETLQQSFTNLILLEVHKCPQSKSLEGNWTKDELFSQLS